MVVDVGPTSSASVLAWVGYAQKVVAEASNDPRTVGVTVTDEVLADFGRYLAEWTEVAEAGPTFRWSAEVDPEVAVYLVYAFFKVADRLTEQARQRGTKLMPAEGEEFYRDLVEAVLDALVAEGESTAEFAEHLRTFWPRFEQ